MTTSSRAAVSALDALRAWPRTTTEEGNLPIAPSPLSRVSITRVAGTLCLQRRRDPVAHDGIAGAHDLVRPDQPHDPFAISADMLHDVAEHVANLCHLLAFSDLVADADLQSDEPTTRRAYHDAVHRRDSWRKSWTAAVDHVETAHHIARPREMHPHVRLVERAVATGLGENRDDAATRRGQIERAGERRRRARLGGQRDQGRTERAREHFAPLVQVAISRERVAGEGKEIFAHVAGMEIDMIFGGADDLRQQHVRQNLGDGPVAPARCDLVEVESIER